MTNAEIIASTLDGLLDHEVSLVAYGRASIALGFDDLAVVRRLLSSRSPS